MNIPLSRCCCIPSANICNDIKAIVCIFNIQKHCKIKITQNLIWFSTSLACQFTICSMHRGSPAKKYGGEQSCFINPPQHFDWKQPKSSIHFLRLVYLTYVTNVSHSQTPALQSIPHTEWRIPGQSWWPHGPVPHLEPDLGPMESHFPYNY